MTPREESRRYRAIVPRSRRMSEDFKCSSTLSDYPCLLEQLARFARIPVEITCVKTDIHGGMIHLTVRSQDGEVELQLPSRKYPNPEWFLGFLNILLTEQRSRYRLIVCAEPGAQCEEVVRATPEEADELKRGGYVVDTRKRG